MRFGGPHRPTLRGCCGDGGAGRKEEGVSTLGRVRAAEWRAGIVVSQSLSVVWGNERMVMVRHFVVSHSVGRNLIRVSVPDDSITNHGRDHDRVPRRAPTSTAQTSEACLGRRAWVADDGPGRVWFHRRPLINCTSLQSLEHAVVKYDQPFSLRCYRGGERAWYRQYSKTGKRPKFLKTLVDIALVR